MVEVFKFNSDMNGKTFYFKPIPIKWEGKFTYVIPIQMLWSMYNYRPSYKYFNYFIINGELKLHIYGKIVFEQIKKYLYDKDGMALNRINSNNVIQFKVNNKRGYLDLGDNEVISLDDCDIENKSKYVINTQPQYDELIKDIDLGQLYQVIYEECNTTLSYTEEPIVIREVTKLRDEMNLKLRSSKLIKLKEMI